MLALIWLDGTFYYIVIVRTVLHRILPFFFAKFSELQFNCHHSVLRTPYLFRSNWYIGLRNKIPACITGLNAHGYISLASTAGRIGSNLLERLKLMLSPARMKCLGLISAIVIPIYWNMHGVWSIAMDFGGLLWAIALVRTWRRVPRRGCVNWPRTPVHFHILQWVAHMNVVYGVESDWYGLIIYTEYT